MKKRLFSKIVVFFCIAEIAFMQFWAMSIADRDFFLVTGLLTANHAVFGGELLLVCLKRIFAGNEKTKRKSDLLKKEDDICTE